MRIKHLTERLLLRQNQSALRRGFINRRHEYHQIILRNQIADDIMLRRIGLRERTEHFLERRDALTGDCARQNRVLR